MDTFASFCMITAARGDLISMGKLPTEIKYSARMRRRAERKIVYAATGLAGES